MYPMVVTTGINQKEIIYKLFTHYEGASNLVIANKLSFIEEEYPVGGTQALVQLAHLAKKNDWKGQKDLAVNHNKYFVEANLTKHSKKK